MLAIKPVTATCILVTILGVFTLLPQAMAAKPTWAKRAVAFPSQCETSSNNADGSQSPRTALAPLPPSSACKPLRILSPDGQSSVEIAYFTTPVDEGDMLQEAFLRVRFRDRGIREAHLPAGFQNVDLLWSPDSRAFFVNGGNGGGYWGFWVFVYVLEGQDLIPSNVTDEAQRDMVKLFPPCKATWLDKDTCKAMEERPDCNMTGIDWDGDSSRIVVMAEVPCSGGHGGIMCQVMGYELDVPTGHIFKRMSARQFSALWQKSMAWKFKVPPPPEYCNKPSDRKRRPCAGHDW